MWDVIRSIEFERPHYLSYWWAGVLFVVLVRGVSGYVARRALRNAYSDPRNLNRTTRPLSLTGQALSTAVWSVCAALLAVALAEPFATNQPVVVPQGSIHAVAVFGRSASDFTEDYANVLPRDEKTAGVKARAGGPWGSRYQVGAWIFIHRIMAAMPGNKIGLVAYTGDASVASQMREDYATLRWVMQETNWLDSPGDGSDPAEGLKAAIQVLRKQYDGKKRCIVFLFTDGGITALEKDKPPDAKAIWERDFARTLKELQGLKQQAEKDGGAEPEVIIIGLGGDEPLPVPLYYPNGDRARNQSGEPLYFPEPGQTMDQAPRSAIEKDNIAMLQARIGAIVRCRYVRIALNWGEIEKVNWVEDVIGGERSSLGKRYFFHYPLLTAMALMFLLFARGLVRKSDALDVRTKIAR